MSNDEHAELPETVTVNAFLDEDSLAEELTAAVAVIRVRLSAARRAGAVRSSAPLFRLVVDNCEFLWQGEHRRANGQALQAIARMGRAANVQVMLRTATPGWLMTGKSRLLDLSTIGDALIRDMIAENLDAEGVPPYPALAFEVA